MLDMTAPAELFEFSKSAFEMKTLDSKKSPVHEHHTYYTLSRICITRVSSDTYYRTLPRQPWYKLSTNETQRLSTVAGLSPQLGGT